MDLAAQAVEGAAATVEQEHAAKRSASVRPAKRADAEADDDGSEEFNDLQSNNDDAKDEDYNDDVDDVDDGDGDDSGDEDYTPAPKRAAAGSRKRTRSAPGPTDPARGEPSSSSTSSTKPAPAKKPRKPAAPRAPKFSSIKLKAHLNALTKEQLVDIIVEAAISHEDIRDKFLTSAPAADVASIMSELNVLMSKLYRSFPQCRYGSNRDGFSFRRVKTPLGNVKEFILNKGSSLVKSQHWPSIVDYLCTVWPHALDLPTFVGVSENVRGSTLSRLVGMFKKAVKAKKKLDAATLQKLRAGLAAAASSSPEAAELLKEL